MNLQNKTRAELETVSPSVVQEEDNAILVRCLDTYDLWALKSDISVTPCLRNDGYWESWITSWFTHNISEGDFVVDIGANCGYFTMLFETLVGLDGRVVAYEASKRYAELLERTREYNRAGYVVENLAVSDKPGVLTLTYPGDYTGSASVVGTPFSPHWGEEHYETVKATTLDIEFEGMDTPQLLKIDAESAEELIWNGAKNLLARHDAPVVVLEYTAKAYSTDFNKALFDYGTVTRIGTDGNEYPTNVEYLNNLQDWDMIVIRKK